MSAIDPGNFKSPRHSARIAQDLQQLNAITTYSTDTCLLGDDNETKSAYIFLHRSTLDPLSTYRATMDYLPSDSNSAPTNAYMPPAGCRADDFKKLIAPILAHKAQINHLVSAIRKLASVDVLSKEERNAVKDGHTYIEMLLALEGAIIEYDRFYHQDMLGAPLPLPGTSEHDRYIQAARKIGATISTEDQAFSEPFAIAKLASDRIDAGVMEGIVDIEKDIRVATALKAMQPLMKELQQALDKERTGP